jgi:hypothetical protein
MAIAGRIGRSLGVAFFVVSTASEAAAQPLPAPGARAELVVATFIEVMGRRGTALGERFARESAARRM